MDRKGAEPHAQAAQGAPLPLAEARHLRGHRAAVHHPAPLAQAERQPARQPLERARGHGVVQRLERRQHGGGAGGDKGLQPPLRAHEGGVQRRRGVGEVARQLHLRGEGRPAAEAARRLAAPGERAVLAQRELGVGGGRRARPAGAPARAPPRARRRGAAPCPPARRRPWPARSARRRGGRRRVPPPSPRRRGPTPASTSSRRLSPRSRAEVRRSMNRCISRSCRGVAEPVLQRAGLGLPVLRVAQPVGAGGDIGQGADGGQALGEEVDLARGVVHRAEVVGHPVFGQAACARGQLLEDRLGQPHVLVQRGLPEVRRLAHLPQPAQLRSAAGQGGDVGVAGRGGAGWSRPPPPPPASARPAAAAWRASAAGRGARRTPAGRLRHSAASSGWKRWAATASTRSSSISGASPVTPKLPSLV